MYANILCSRFDIFERDIRIVERNIIYNRVGEQKYILQHDGNLFPDGA